MGENSAISWTDHTFNAWIGCQEVSPACDFCYAKRQNEHRKWVKGWGPDGERRMTSDTNWQKPLRWQKGAATFMKLHGRRQRVFCLSLADALDNKAQDEWRTRLWALIAATPDLDWMLLTKRPQNARKMMPAVWLTGAMPDNVWLGCTVENEEEAQRRIPHLLAIPVRTRFLSCEPLLGPISLAGITPAMIAWVIAGGESGPHARPSHPDWFRSLRDQCTEAGVAFHFKQWGEWGEPMKDQYFNTLSGRAGRPPAFIMEENGNVHCTGFTAGMNNAKVVVRNKVSHTGRALDGRTWDEFPVPH